MSHLYVTNNGSSVTIDGGRIKIKQKDGMIRTVPKETIESISVFGNSSITTPCIQYLLTAGIPVCFYSTNGSYFGRLVSTSDNKVDIIKQQINMFDDMSYAMDIGRSMLKAKVHNQEIVLKRYIKNLTRELEHNLRMIHIYKHDIEEAEDVNQLMGYEGIAARTYFDSLSRIVDPEFAFSGRSKRPPRDKFNSLLSLGYTLLMYEIYPKIQVTGMTPYYSVMHKSYGDHPALASDLMEEWRAFIVDSVVLSLVQGHEIKPDDFNTDESPGIYLTNNGLKKFIKKFERKLNTDIRYLQYDNKTYSIREAIRVQCSKLKESITKQDASVYKPLMIK